MRWRPIADSEESRLAVGVRVTIVNARCRGARYQMTVADVCREVMSVCPFPNVL